MVLIFKALYGFGSGSNSLSKLLSAQHHIEPKIDCATLAKNTPNWMEAVTNWENVCIFISIVCDSISLVNFVLLPA